MAADDKRRESRRVTNRPLVTRSPATTFSEISSIKSSINSASSGHSPIRSSHDSRDTSLIRAQDRERAHAGSRVRVHVREPSPGASTVLEPRQTTKRLPFGFYVTLRERPEHFLKRQEQHRQEKARELVLVRPPEAYPSRTVRNDLVPSTFRGRSSSGSNQHIAHTAGSRHHSHRSPRSRSHAHRHHESPNLLSHHNDAAANEPAETVLDPSLRLHPHQFKHKADWRGTTYAQYAGWDPVEQRVLEDIIAHYGRITGHAYPSGKEGFSTALGPSSGSETKSRTRTKSGSNARSGSSRELELHERRGLSIRSVKWKAERSGPNLMTVYYSENEPGFDPGHFRDDQLGESCYIYSIYLQIVFFVCELLLMHVIYTQSGSSSHMILIQAN